MWHVKTGLTVNSYTDPRLLDIADALAVLPKLTLGDEPSVQRQQATSTNGDAAEYKRASTRTDKPFLSKVTGILTGTAENGGNSTPDSE